MRHIANDRGWDAGGRTDDGVDYGSRAIERRVPLHSHMAANNSGCDSPAAGLGLIFVYTGLGSTSCFLTSDIGDHGIDPLIGTDDHGIDPFGRSWN